MLNLNVEVELKDVDSHINVMRSKREALERHIKHLENYKRRLIDDLEVGRIRVKMIQEIEKELSEFGDC